MIRDIDYVISRLMDSSPATEFYCDDATIVGSTHDNRRYLRQIPPAEAEGDAIVSVGGKFYGYLSDWQQMSDLEFDSRLNG